MKNRIDLTIQARETGKHNSRSLRSSRQVPAIVYGTLDNPINISVQEKDIVKYNTRAYENVLYNLKGTGTKADGIVVLLKDVDVHPVTRRPQHVDFYALDLTKPVRVDVEVRLEGKSIGVANGGLLNIVLRAVEVECLPTEIPDYLVADITELNIGDALHVSDIKVSGSVKILTGQAQTLVVIAEQKEEEATPAAAEEAPAAAPAKK